MGDIDPEDGSVEAFNRKQKAFREQLVAAQKERDASGFLSPSPDADDAPKGLGSLSTASTSERAAEIAEKEPPRKAGPLTNLIYGTKEGRELDAQLEASFSQVIARGKYVHSIVFHDVKPDKVDEYVELVGNWYPRMASLPENKVHLVGSWRTEVGDVDTFGAYPLLPCLAHRREHHKLTPTQSISGSTNDTRATTPLSTTSHPIPSSRSSTRN